MYSKVVIGLDGTILVKLFDSVQVAQYRFVVFGDQSIRHDVRGSYLSNGDEVEKVVQHITLYLYWAVSPAADESNW